MQLLRYYGPVQAKCPENPSVENFDILRFFPLKFSVTRFWELPLLPNNEIKIICGGLWEQSSCNWCNVAWMARIQVHRGTAARSHADKFTLFFFFHTTLMPLGEWNFSSLTWAHRIGTAERLYTSVALVWDLWHSESDQMLFKFLFSPAFESK